MINSTSSLIKRAFRLSFSNIWRNKFLSIATVFVIGTIIFIFNIILAVNLIAKDSLTDLNQKIDITVYLQQNANFEAVTSLQQQLLNLEGVNNVKYTSKDDALLKIKTTHPDLSLAFEKYSLGNPLPASLNITTAHPQYHQDVADYISQDQFRPLFTRISSISDNENSTIISSVSRNLLQLTNFANQIIFWLIMIFIVGGALIILNAIQMAIFHRKREITVMKLVGAPYWLIRLPYIIESLAYGILAVILSFIMLLILANHVQIQGAELANYYQQIQFSKIFLYEILATVILSFLSAILAIHEYLYENRHN